MSDLLKDVSGGEWVAGIESFSTGRDKCHVMIAAYGPNCSAIIACTYGNTPQEALANAKLMAAAKDMAEALRPLAAYPIEEFDSEGARKDDHPLFAANGRMITVGDVRKARAALKKAGAA